MRHKVVLYNPKAVFWTMPLALVAVASALDRETYEVIIVDGRIDPPETLFHHLRGALCLGLTALTGAPLKDALTITGEVGEKFPELAIVWGGWHPSLFPRMCADHPGISAAVIGQGEETFAEILASLAASASLDGVKGCAYALGDGRLKINPGRPNRDINAFPAFDFGLIDVERYFQRKGRRQMDYVSSQGCRFRCNFCADPAVFKRGWFGFEPERVTEEVGELWRRYRFEDLALQDETYFTHKKRVAHIAEGFLRRDLKFTWTATMRADQGRRLDESGYELCRHSGLRRVIIGLEAGDQATIDQIQKDIKIEDMWITAENLVRHGIGAVINVIVGFPDEPPESVVETLRVARELRKMSADFQLSVYYFKPYPGNPIAERLERNGYRFPTDLPSWADFDYIGEGNQWLTPAQKSEIENFKFYQHYAYDGRRDWFRWPLKKLSRWRVEHLDYRLPWERALLQKLRPSTPLS